MVARGTHPNSLANLRPFAPGEQGNTTGARGPIITPAMRKYAHYSYIELEALAHSPKADLLPLKDVIAITWLLKAARDVQWGDKARDDLTKRLDGDIPKLDVDVSGGLLVRYIHGGQK